MAWRICIVQTGHALFGFEYGVIISNFHPPIIMVDNSDVLDTSKTEDFIKYVQLQRLDRVLVSLFTMFTTLTKFYTNYRVMCKVYTDVGGIKKNSPV